MPRIQCDNRKRKMKANRTTKKEMIACLQRSGYLLEGRLVKYLNAMGLFVEPNQSFLDEKTGISREIDIVAEDFRCSPDSSKVRVKTIFVMEAINNLYPVVLLTPRIWSPNTCIDDYLPYKVTPSEIGKNQHFILHVDPLEIKEIFEWSIFSQFCAFTRKKNGDLMASHPEDLYTSISKVAYYVFLSKDKYHGWMDKKDDEYWRLFQWKAVVVLQKDLYITQENTEGMTKLIKTRCAKLEYNFHYLGEPKTIVVDFVTESAVSQIVKKELDYDEIIEKKIIQLKRKEI